MRLEFRTIGEGLQAIWTDEAVEQLKSWATEGLTGSKIAALFGVSRNAVLGKKDRLGIRLIGTKRSDTPRAERRRAARAITQASRPATPRERGSHVDLRHLGMPVSNKPAFLELTSDMCHYPTGDGEFCGHPAVYPYCPFHWRLTHVPSRPR